MNRKQRKKYYENEAKKYLELPDIPFGRTMNIFSDDIMWRRYPLYNNPNFNFNCHVTPYCILVSLNYLNVDVLIAVKYCDFILDV